MHVVATAGHVDHGKSTLLRAITGMEPDRWEEERARGLTIDLGFVWTELSLPGDGDGPLTVAFVDVPGHERFISNMLAGAGAVRLALFVVAADDGWSAQSQEHLDILDLLGVEAAVATVTKSDTVDGDRAAAVAADVRDRLTTTTLAGAPVLLTDAVSGRGVPELVEALAVRLRELPSPHDARRTRLWIDRSFSVSGAGTVVTGSLEEGTLEVGGTVAILPAGETVRIRALQALGTTVERVLGPARVAVNLAGVARAHVGRGDALVTGGTDPGMAWVTSRAVDAWLRVLPGGEVDVRGAWHLHVGSAETTCTVLPLLPGPIRPHQPAPVRIELDHPLPLQSGDRFVLRESGRRATIAGGEVLDPAPLVRARGGDARLAHAAQLEALLGVTDRRRALVELAGGARPAALTAAAAGHRPDALPPAGLTRVGGWLADDDELGHWSQAMLQRVAAIHGERPDHPGPTRRELAAAAREAGCPDDSLAAALPDHLAGQGRLRRMASSYALPEHVPAAEHAADARREQFLEVLARDPLGPPRLEEAAKEAGLGYQEVQALAQDGAIVRCGEIAFTRAAVDDAVARLRELAAERPQFSASEARDAWGTTRKYAIPLLEHLDAAGITAFDGQLRSLRG